MESHTRVSPFIALEVDNGPGLEAKFPHHVVPSGPQGEQEQRGVGHHTPTVVSEVRVMM